MKNKHYIVKGTPIVPSLCGIGMALLWYFSFYFGQGKWTTEMNTFDFEGLSGGQIYLTVLNLVLPIVYFVCVLFLAEIDLKWMLPALLAPIVQQVSLFIWWYAQGSVDYIFVYPFRFVVPFAAVILFVLTVEKLLPNKWFFVGFCGIAIVVPLILTFCKIGEFTYTSGTTTFYLWSEYLTYALTYLGLGALVLQMRAPRESDFVSLKEMQQAYDEKVAAEVAEEEETAEEAEFLTEEAEEETQSSVEETEEAPTEEEKDPNQAL